MVPDRYVHIILEYSHIGNLSIGEVEAHAERANATAAYIPLGEDVLCQIARL